MWLATAASAHVSTYMAPWGCPAPPECVGDIDGDDDTDHGDLGALLGAWESQPGDPHWNPDADLDGDGWVGHSDLGIPLGDWGCPWQDECATSSHKPARGTRRAW